MFSTKRSHERRIAVNSRAVVRGDMEPAQAVTEISAGVIAGVLLLLFTIFIVAAPDA